MLGIPGMSGRGELCRGTVAGHAPVFVDLNAAQQIVLCNGVRIVDGLFQRPQDRSLIQPH